jgi:hypothetical protein
LARSKPEEAQRLAKLAQEDIDWRWKFYSHMAEKADGGDSGNGNGPSTSVKQEVKEEVN